MPPTIFRGRRATSIENSFLRVTVLQDGGHLAEVFDKQAGVSPLWIPPWPSIEPSAWNAAQHPQYGHDAEARLLGGIMGHNLCLDIFGAPTPQEAATGLTVHGEASIAPYQLLENGTTMVAKAHLPHAHLNFERTLELRDRSLRILETVENLVAWDRPIAWTQHVTLGPPFLQKQNTQLRATVTRSRVFETKLGADMHFAPAADFDWPMVPLAAGGTFDLRTLSDAPASTEYTAHLADPQATHASFVAFTPEFRLAFAYTWKRTDFPWLGIWREDCSRQTPPWSGHTRTLGLEFGVSPIPENRRAMIERGPLFGTATYRWLPALGKLEAEYRVVTQSTDTIPDFIAWPD